MTIRAPLTKILLIAIFFMGLHTCERFRDKQFEQDAGIDLAQLKPQSVNQDFAAPADSRELLLDNGLVLNEKMAAHGLDKLPASKRWHSYGYNYNRELITILAPGLDRHHHFVNAYLVNYVPFDNVAAWVPLYALAKTKFYQYDHEQYHAMDLWQTSRQAFFYPRGDCEDHALALADWLIGLGYDARVVLGTYKKEGHAWVVLLQDNKTYLLEATDKSSAKRKTLPLAFNFPDYHPESMFNREQFWVNTGSMMTTNYRSAQWHLRSHYRQQAQGMDKQDNL